MELTKKTTILFPPELHERLVKLASQRGVSLERVIAELNEYIRGWWGYFSHCEARSCLRLLNAWVIRRLRSAARGLFYTYTRPCFARIAGGPQPA